MPNDGVTCAAKINMPLYLFRYLRHENVRCKHGLFLAESSYYILALPIVITLEGGEDLDYD